MIKNNLIKDYIPELKITLPRNFGSIIIVEHHMKQHAARMIPEGCPKNHFKIISNLIFDNNKQVNTIILHGAYNLPKNYKKIIVAFAWKDLQQRLQSGTRWYGD